MNKPEIYGDILEKNILVTSIGRILAEFPRNRIVGARYEYWTHKTHQSWHRENVVLEFRSGAIEVRNVTGNSVNAVYRSIGQLLDGGYYDEVDDYNEMVASGIWEKLDLSNPDNYTLRK